MQVCKPLCRLALAGLAWAGLCQAEPAPPLPSYNLSLHELTVSGVSSGAYMAVQMAVAHSAAVTGIGAIAGGPYGCAEGRLDLALGRCMIGQPRADAALAQAQRDARRGAIDPLSNLSRQKVWLFSGYNDGVIKTPVSDALYDFYRASADPGNVYYRDDLGAAHAMPTAGYGRACDETGGDFINDCGYDAAGLLLQHLYGLLQRPRPDDAPGQLLAFDQAAFVQGDPRALGLAPTGYLYVPALCAAREACRLHVVFHGCRQYAGLIGDRFYRHAGYNAWADANRIVVLYPQTVPTVEGLNDGGCWDWRGYYDADYATQRGRQLQALWAMMRRLAGGEGATIAWGEATPALQAIDAGHRRVDLAWRPVEGALGYHVYRAPGGAGVWQRVNGAPVQGASYADDGLAPNTTYRYTVRAVTSDGREGAEAPPVTIITRRAPPACDPYYRNNVAQVSEGRAYVAFGLAYARGSWQYMGWWSPLFSTLLRRTGPEEFRVGPCPS